MRTTAAAALVGAVAALACVVPTALGATIAVSTTADVVAADGACGLREAIAAAGRDVATPGAGECPAGSPDAVDRIVLGPGVFALTRAGAGEDDDATGDLDVRGPVAIVGAGAGETTIDARGLDRVLDVLPGADVSLEGLTITGGVAPAGAAPGADGGAGGGIRNRGTLALAEARVVGNAGGAGAAGVAAAGGVAPNGVAGAPATGGLGGAGGAGGIAGTGPLTLTDTVVTGNRGGSGGAGGAATGGSAGPGPLGAGGGDARGGDGGDGGAGGVSALGPLTVVRGAILDNRAGAGGRAGDAQGGAGAGGGDGGSGGSATGGAGGDGGDGGGVLSAATLTIRESVIASNLTAVGGQGGTGTGGARSGLANALGAGVGGPGGAGGDGGGLAVAAGSADILNTTIASNLTGPGGAGGAGGAGIPGGGPGSAGGAGGLGGTGGGVAAGGGLVAAFATIAANGEGGDGTDGRAGDVSAPGAVGAAGAPGAGASAGVRAEGPTALTRSILAGNGCAGAAFPASDASGLAWAAPGCPGAVGDPALGALGANGGPTVTMRPGAGGAAIDRVPAGACPPTDQRGAARPTGAACDAGAVELAPPVAVTGAPGRVTDLEADVAATVDTRGLTAEYYVDFGPTPAYGGRTAGVLIPGASGPTAVTATLTGLSARTVFHYRVVAVGPDGVSAGADRTFETPVVVPARASRDGARPRVLGLALAPRAFAVLAPGARLTAATRTRPARGARITVRLSARAPLVLAVRRAAPGRRVTRHGATRCLPIARGIRVSASARCTRYPTIGTVRRVVPAGLSRFTFTGRLGGTPLRPGAYRLEASALDALARPSAPARVAFRVVSPPVRVSRAR